MCSLRRIGIFALVQTCLFHGSCGRLKVRVYKVSTDRKWLGYKIVQHCLYEVAAVSRISIKKIYDIYDIDEMVDIIEFTVTATELAFWRIYSKCNVNYFGLGGYAPELQTLGGLELAPYSEEYTYVTYGEAVQHQLEKLPIASGSRYYKRIPFIKSNVQSNDEVVCLVQRYHLAEQECRTCLRQKNKFRPLREFHVWHDGSDYVLFVLHTSHAKKDIIEACTITDACAEFSNVYHDQVCREVHNREVSKYPETEHMQCLQTSFHAESEEFYAYKGEEVYFRLSMMYLSESDGRFMHFLNTGIPYKEQAFLLLWSKHLVGRSQLSPRENFSYKKEIMEKCYKNYDALLDHSPTVNVISANLPAPAVRVIIPLSSNCVVAYQKFHGRCNECIGATDYNSQSLTSKTFLFRFTADQKEKFGTCILEKNTNTCTRFLVVPNEICDHEILEQSVGKNVLSQNEVLPGPTVVRVNCLKIECFKCLVLHFEVLVVSKHRKYVWMVSDERVGNCDGAKSTKYWFKLPDYPLQRISRVQLYAMMQDVSARTYSLETKY